MTIDECYLYIHQRLNKSVTNTNDNIAKYSFVSAFNTMQLIWAESRIKSNESNTIRKDEVRLLLDTTTITPDSKTDKYYEALLPDNYFHYERSTSLVPCEINNKLVKEGNINTLLLDDNWKPSIEWGETICTLVGNSLRIYVDNFSISQVNLVYYRFPKLVSMADGFSDINGMINTNINPEFQGINLIEILNLTCQLLSGDATDQWTYQTSAQINQNT